ncbi:MAG: Holliday junction resolvase RuvX [Pseudomonadota bacterium]|nr:Holliday junction resolvase RuvX [Pseudomonadota bacterium]
MKGEIILGFDYGEKKIGVAVGNMLTKITTPLFNLNQMQHKVLFEHIDKIVEEWKPFMFIIGLPELNDGSNHPLKNVIDQFKNNLEVRYKKPVVLINEKLSSHEAYKIRGLYDKNKPLDAIAASLIIKTWILEST